MYIQIQYVYILDGIFVEVVTDDVGGLGGLVVAQISKDRVIINVMENAIFEIFVVSMLFGIILNPLPPYY